MDQKAIETLSVNAVRDSIVVSDYLDQCIADNDKEPSWDGFVYIYNDKSKKKSKLEGRLPVQIKGTENNDLTREEISFSVSTIDLTNYLYDGGVVFFVVYIDKNGINKQIYYVELPPIKIRVLLDEAKEQKSTSIKLKKFPDDSKTKAMVFLNCLRNCQKQASFCSARLLSLEELEKAGVLESVSIPVSTVVGVDPKAALLSNEVYLYANIKGCAIPQPIELIPKGMLISEEKATTITVGDRLFYTKVKLIRSADTVKTIIGESFSIDVTIKDYSVKSCFTGTSNLRSLVVDLDFLLAYIENKHFSYNGIDISFNEAGADFSRFSVSIEKDRLNYLQKIVCALDYLGCKKDLNIKALRQNDWRNIDCLVRAFVDRKPVSGLKIDFPPVSFIDVGDLKFLVCATRVENKPDTYEIFDFFQTDFLFIYDNMNGEKLPISQYAILHADDLVNADNIRYDVLLPSFQKVERHSELISRANSFLLELIEAYDKDNSKTELITTASSFADWIMEATEEELPYDIRLLNRLQIEKRMGSFSTEQVKELLRLVETPETKEEVLVGAYLLLGEQTAAEVHFEKMDQHLQEEFKKYPICHFWNITREEK